MDPRALSPLPRVLFLLLPRSWFAEGSGEFLSPGWGLSLSCTPGDGHGYSVLSASASTARFFKKLHFRVRPTPAQPLFRPVTGICRGLLGLGVDFSVRGCPSSARCGSHGNFPSSFPLRGRGDGVSPIPERWRSGGTVGECGGEAAAVFGLKTLPAAHAASGAAECGSAISAAPSRQGALAFWAVGRVMELLCVAHSRCDY